MISINKKIAMSGLSILTALSLMSGATYAFFSDTATSSNNTFATGNLNLQLDDADQTVTENVTASITGSGMVPGGTPITGFVSLHNGGSVNIAEIELLTTVNETADPGNDSFLGDVMNMTVATGDDQNCTTNGTDLTGTLATAYGDHVSPLTLSELNSQTYDALPGLNTGATKYLCLTAQMASTAGNTYQGDSLSVDFALTGNQDASQ